MKWFGIALAGAVALLVLGGGIFAFWANPRVAQELRETPEGDRAKKVMLLTLPSGKAIPVNYHREGGTVYAASDFLWWRELRGGGGRGSVLIRGETLRGHIRVVEDDLARREAVFAELRPTAPRWAGKLIVVELD